MISRKLSEMVNDEKYIDKKESRKDRFNYPLCVCVLLFLAAGILTVFVY